MLEEEEGAEDACEERGIVEAASEGPRGPPICCEMWISGGDADDCCCC